jgi:hypothetical protein
MRQDVGLINNDFNFIDGDFSVVNSDDQHIIDTIASFKGWWKQYPLDGVGIAAYQKSSLNIQELQKNIRIQLESDGYKVNNPSITLSSSGELLINPNATI